MTPLSKIWVKIVWLVGNANDFFLGGGAGICSVSVEVVS